MLAAMAGAAVEDMFLKSASVLLPVGQILMIFGAGGMIAPALQDQLPPPRLRHCT